MGQAATALKHTSYAAVNLIWKNSERIDIGVEVLHGMRQNKDGQNAEATRLMFSFLLFPGFRTREPRFNSPE